MLDNDVDEYFDGVLSFGDDVSGRFGSTNWNTDDELLNLLLLVSCWSPQLYPESREDES
jgi:hypothetical protein